MKSLFNLFSCLVILVFLLFCATDEKNKIKFNNTHKKEIDTVIKDIPKDKKGRPRSYYKNKMFVENKIGLETLENGFDSIQIRIWYGYAFKDSSQLIIIKKTQGKWFGIFYTLKYNYNEKRDSIIGIENSLISKKPKSSWEIFINNFLAIGILDLPDYKEIPNYYQGADGDAIIVEIGTQNKYRIFSYQEPNLKKAQFLQAMKMEEALELIENEFNFFRLRK